MPQPYKTLVLCFDGTWNTLKSQTNVSRLYSEIAHSTRGSRTQRKFYDEGVGTHWYDRFRGGALSFGLDPNIRLGYAWLASIFESKKGAAPTGDAEAAPEKLASRTRKPEWRPDRRGGTLVGGRLHPGFRYLHLRILTWCLHRPKPGLNDQLPGDSAHRPRIEFPNC